MRIILKVLYQTGEKMSTAKKIGKKSLKVHFQKNAAVRRYLRRGRGRRRAAQSAGCATKPQIHSAAPMPSCMNAQARTRAEGEQSRESDGLPACLRTAAK